MVSDLVLNKFKERIASFQQIHLYNHKVVDVYLLASHGLVYSHKKDTPSAICSNPTCRLTIEFDSGQGSLKEDLQQIVTEHDQDCEFLKIKGNMLGLKFFQEQGKKIYNQGFSSFKERGIWLQLKPQQVFQTLKSQKNRNNNTDEQKRSIIINQFIILDSLISKDPLTKVSSVVFLTIFGWKWKQNTIIICQFCGSHCQVKDFMSPCQYSLMKVQKGFAFKNSHKSWCCIIDCQKQYWKQILRQGVLIKLEILPSSKIRCQYQSKILSIQRECLDIYEKQIKKINELRKRINWKKIELRENNTWSEPIKKKVQMNVNKLEILIEEQKYVTQEFIKKLNEKKDNN